MPKPILPLLSSVMALAVVAFGNLSASEPATAPALNQGLVAYYPFSGSADDASGNGNHASVTGAMLADDKFGTARSAFYLDGKKDSMVAPVCISPSVMPQVTMVVWAKAEQKDHMATLFSNATDSRSSRALSMRPSPGKGGCWATSTNSYGSWVWHKVEVDKWTFLAISFDQKSKKLHLQVDDSKYEADCSQIDGMIDLSIGKNPLTGQYFHGFLDEIRVYDRILNDGEITALYHQFQFGNQAQDDPASITGSSRRGLLLTFVTGFSLFAGMVLVANIMIRRRSTPG